MRRRRRVFGCGGLLIVPFCLLLLVVSVWARQRWHTEKITIDGTEREYQLHVPDNLPDHAPLLIVLHGGGGSGRQIRTATGFDTLADEQRFIVVYPYGLAHQWNDGRDIHYSETDDVAFISALIDHLAAEYAIDTQRIFVTGISNGGGMSYYLACQLSERIAGAAPVAMNMTAAVMDSCQPSRPMPMLIMNGTSDPIVPYEGGMITVLNKDRGEVVSVDESVAFWAAHNQCDSQLQETLPDTDPDDGTRVYRRVYTGCVAPVQAYRIAGGGHNWAGSSPPLLRDTNGNISQDIDASRVIWEFFAGLDR